jgi:hypothetical protein
MVLVIMHMQRRKEAIPLSLSLSDIHNSSLTNERPYQPKKKKKKKKNKK